MNKKIHDKNNRCSFEYSFEKNLTWGILMLRVFFSYLV